MVHFTISISFNATSAAHSWRYSYKYSKGAQNFVTLYLERICLTAPACNHLHVYLMQIVSFYRMTLKERKEKYKAVFAVHIFKLDDKETLAHISSYTLASVFGLGGASN